MACSSPAETAMVPSMVLLQAAKPTRQPQSSTWPPKHSSSWLYPMKGCLALLGHVSHPAGCPSMAGHLTPRRRALQSLQPLGAAIVLEARHLADGPEASYSVSTAASGCFEDSQGMSMQVSQCPLHLDFFCLPPCPLLPQRPQMLQPDCLCSSRSRAPACRHPAFS